MTKTSFTNRLLIFMLLFIYSCKPEEHEKATKKTVVNRESISIEDNFLPRSTTNQIIYHKNYTLSYNEKYEQAEWVAYSLKRENLKDNRYKRPYFIEDNKVTTQSANWRNYKNSGYDKGHLCPAGDMAFSKEAYEETFLTSNITPQKHDFNSGIWNRLEQKVRYWADKYREVYVISGGILTSGLKTIGSEDVAVPNYFYKIIATKTNGKLKIIAFLLPHKNSEKSLYSFTASVDEIEKLTGIDFFPKLEDSLENRLEKNSDYKDWNFN